MDPSFRNGTLTGIGIVSAFSLGFLTRWAGVPGTWTITDKVALCLIVLGIVFQVRSLHQFLDVDSLIVANHRRYVRTFTAGLALTAVGIAVAMIADILGFGGTVMRG